MVLTPPATIAVGRTGKMTRLNDLEAAAICSIASNYPGVEPELVRILESCLVTKRENTGQGFFTTLTSQPAAFAPIGLRSPLGEAPGSSSQGYATASAATCF
jgi:hypothetical protein